MALSHQPVRSTNSNRTPMIVIHCFWSLGVSLLFRISYRIEKVGSVGDLPNQRRSILRLYVTTLFGETSQKLDKNTTSGEENVKREYENKTRHCVAFRHLDEGRRIFQMLGELAYLEDFRLSASTRRENSDHNSSAIAMYFFFLDRCGVLY